MTRWPWGELAEHEADYVAAIPRYRNAVTFGERYPAALRHLAELELQEGDAESARIRLQDLEDFGGADVERVRALLRATAESPTAMQQ